MVAPTKTHPPQCDTPALLRSRPYAFPALHALPARPLARRLDRGLGRGGACALALRAGRTFLRPAITFPPPSAQNIHRRAPAQRDGGLRMCAFAHRHGPLPPEMPHAPRFCWWAYAHSFVPRPPTARVRAPAAMPGVMAMEFTKKFLRAKSPCADGFRWFSRHVEDGSGYQQALDTLVNAGRVGDACWLLSQFGPTNEVLTLDRLEADALVFAGTLVVRGNVDVSGVLQTGRSIRAGGGLRAGESIVVGEDVRVAGAIVSQGLLQVGGDLRADWGVEAEGDIRCGGDLRAGWDVVCHGTLALKGGAFVGQDLIAHGSVECDKGVRVGGHLTGAASVRVGQGIWVGGAITGVQHLEAGWGIKAGECIHANGAIKAGESLSAGEDIRAGDGYGVFAGLHVQVDTWDASAQVWAQQPPERLRSGVWLGPCVV